MSIVQLHPPTPSRLKRLFGRGAAPSLPGTVAPKRRPDPVKDAYYDPRQFRRSSTDDDRDMDRLRRARLASAVICLAIALACTIYGGRSLFSGVMALVQ